jgi:hypothetical protein
MRELIVSKKQLICFSMAYIYIPIIVFLLGWTRLPIALICIAAVTYGVKHVLRDYIADSNSKGQELRISPWILITSILFFLIVGYYAGWGRFVAQSSDWFKHNAVLSDLVNRPWPVYYLNEIGDGIDEHSMLTYYIAQYLVPALFGKLFHSYRVSEVVNYVWAEIGLILVFLNMIRILQVKTTRMQMLTAFLLCFFSGPLLLGQKILELVYPGEASTATLYHWFSFQNGIRLQYSSNYTMLRWVFPQVIAIWLMVLLFIEHKEKIEDYVALLLPSLLFGTLSFVGILPVAFTMALFMLVKDKNIKHWIKQVFSLSNIAMASTLGIVLVLYFYGNITCKKSDSVGFSAIDYSNGNVWKYVIFIFTMVLIYGICLFIQNKRNPLFYISVGELVLLPFFKMGLYNDFVMRCSIPCLFIMLVMIVDYLNEMAAIGFERMNAFYKLCTMCLIVGISIGLIHPLQEFSDSIKGDNLLKLGDEPKVETMEAYANRYAEGIPDDFKYNYYSYDIDKNIFNKYIARVK